MKETYAEIEWFVERLLRQSFPENSNGGSRMPWRLSIRRKQHGLLSSFSAPRLEREMICRYQLWFGLLFVLHSFVPCPTSAQEVLPPPPIGKYLENNFQDVQIAFLGRVTKVLQSGWFMGPRVFVRDFNRYGQGEIRYSLESFSIDEVFKGADLIKGRRELLIARGDMCNNDACVGSHIDSDKELRDLERIETYQGQSVLVFCWDPRNDKDFISGFLLRLRRELRKRGHSYDFAIFQNCRLADSEKPEALSVIRSYFDGRQGVKP
jgi:hypothetical protein